MKEIDWSLCESSENREHISSVFLEGIKDCFLFQDVREPTRFIEGQIPSILDLILTNKENMVEKIDYPPSLGKSDHVVLSFNFNSVWSVVQNFFLVESWKYFAELIVH